MQVLVINAPDKVISYCVMTMASELDMFSIGQWRFVDAILTHNACESCLTPQKGKKLSKLGKFVKVILQEK